MSTTLAPIRPDDDDRFARAPAWASAAFECFPALIERKRLGDLHLQPAAIDERSEFGKLVMVGCDNEERCRDTAFVGFTGRRGCRQRDQPPASAQHAKDRSNVSPPTVSMMTS